MKPGGKARLVCPPNLAYGDNGAGEMILPGATLDFEVELLEVKPAAAQNSAPAQIQLEPVKK
jgi:FKBP-type peptidyl-prolyl cis-trans isomerase FkpA